MNEEQAAGSDAERFLAELWQSSPLPLFLVSQYFEAQLLQQCCCNPCDPKLPVVTPWVELEGAIVTGMFV